MANEPDITYPFLFNYIKGQEWRSQQKVTELIKQHFHNSPGGIPGNDDAGTLSAWLVFSMMGIYPVSPGDMDYAIIKPAFNEIKIKLNNEYYPAKNLKIKVQGKLNSTHYINQLHFNKVPINNYFIDYKTLVSGGVLNIAVD